MDPWHTYCSAIPKTSRDPYKPQWHLHFAFNYLKGVKGSKPQGGCFILCWLDIPDNHQGQIQTVLSHKAVPQDGHHQFYWAAGNTPLVTTQTWEGSITQKLASVVKFTDSVAAACYSSLVITCVTVCGAQSSQRCFKAQPRVERQDRQMHKTRCEHKADRNPNYIIWSLITYCSLQCYLSWAPHGT